MLKRTVLLLLWLAGSTGSVAWAGVRTTPEGLRIESGGSGYTLAYPEFMEAKGKNAFKPIEVEASGTRARLGYQDGAAVEVTVSEAGEIELRLQKLPATWKQLKMSSMLGFGLAQGGTFAINGGAAKPFPAMKPEKPFLFQGGASTIAVTAGNGDSFTFRLPKNAYLQVMDLREWNWTTYSMGFTVPLGANPGKLQLGVTTGRDAAAAARRPVAIVDILGQNAGSNWPLKAASVEELKADVVSEQAYYASFKPPTLDIYGGLPGSGEKLGLKKTGFFHVEKKGSKWHMVDPEGNLFFQLGVCSMAPYQSDTKVGGHEEVYAWLPPHQGEFGTAWGDGRGRAKDEFNFHLANMIRKYGVPHDFADYSDRMIARVRAFGFNSAGAFGEPDKTSREKHSFPYVTDLPLKQSDGVKMVLRGVPDPFDEGTRKNIDSTFSAKLPERAKDPLLIGYFIVNEPPYDDLPNKVPMLNGTWACKLALVKMLQEKYKTVEAFQTAWGVEAQSFAELNDRGLPLKTQAAAEDMNLYMALFYEALYRVVCDTARKYDPNHMIIGNRFQNHTINNETLCRIAGKYLDVMSHNYYTMGFDRAKLDRTYAWTGGLPMILSEFYWNSPSDSGLPFSLKDVKSQEERGLAYRNYVEAAAASGYVVGVQWYTLLDTHYTGIAWAGHGSFNVNCGLFSVVDRPWKPMVELMAKSNYDIYKVLLGERPPFVWDDPRFRVGASGGTRSVGATRAPAAMVIDGHGEDWPVVPDEEIGSDRVVTGNASSSVSASFKLCWDAANLYVLVHVNDPTPMKNDLLGANIWNSDTIELFVGIEQLEKKGPELFTDKQILFSAGQPPDGKPQFFVRTKQQITQPATLDFKVVPNVDGKGYALEAAIPWQLLAVTPASGLELLFDMGIDDGETGKNRNRQLRWNANSGNAGERTGWGRLRLGQ